MMENDADRTAAFRTTWDEIANSVSLAFISAATGDTQNAARQHDLALMTSREALGHIAYASNATKTALDADPAWNEAAAPMTRACELMAAAIDDQIELIKRRRIFHKPNAREKKRLDDILRLLSEAHTAAAVAYARMGGDSSEMVSVFESVTAWGAEHGFADVS